MHPAVTSFLTAAARTLGAELMGDLYSYLVQRLHDGDTTTAARRATAPEIRGFLAGGPFAEFVAPHVIRDACTRFSTLPEPEQQAVLAVVARQPTAAGAVQELVTYMAQRP